VVTICPTAGILKKNSILTGRRICYFLVTTTPNIYFFPKRT